MTIQVSCTYCGVPIEILNPLTKPIPMETPEEQEARKKRKSGVQLPSPITNFTSIFGIHEQLRQQGFFLTDAYFQNRLKVPGKQGPAMYQMIRFIFKRGSEPDNKDALPVLKLIVTKALWHVRLFLNPLYLNDVEITGKSSISINCEARNTLVGGDGKPIRVWAKDAEGRRIGTAPLPITPTHKLTITEEGEIKIEQI